MESGFVQIHFGVSIWVQNLLKALMEQGWGAPTQHAALSEAGDTVCRCLLSVVS